MSKHVFKQIITTILAAVLCLSLAACGEDNLKKADELYAAGDYAGALEIYNTLDDHEDVKEKISRCEREIGMAENSDNAFLADVEVSVLERLENTEAENNTTVEDLKNLVDVELTRLKKYTNSVFYNNDLAEISNKYIKGLHTQKESLEKWYMCEQQLEWQRGFVLRCEALNELYKNYNFLTDDEKFIESFITPLEENQELLKMYDAVDNDITEQVSTEDFNWHIDEEGKQLYTNLKNNTEYTLNLVFGIMLFDEDDVMYESYTCNLGNIEPGVEYTVGGAVMDIERLATCEFDYYFVTME